MSKSQRDQAIVLALSCDAAFAAHSGVVIQSILSFAKKDQPLEFYILDGGVRKIDRFRLNSLVRGYPRASLTMIDVSDSFDSVSCSQYMNYGRANYYRLLLPGLLPDKDRVLYLDSDLIVRYDLASLFFLDMQGYPIAVCEDLGMKAMVGGSDRAPEDFAAMPAKDYLLDHLEIGDDFISTYFNSGVMLMDLDELRNSDFDRQVDRLLQKHRGAFWFVDQDLLNIVFQGRYRALDLIWNFQTCDVNWLKKYIPDVVETYEKAQERARIIHYVGMGNKPWSNPDGQYSHYYWQQLRDTPWYEEVFAGHIAKKRLGECEKAMEGRLNLKMKELMARYSWRNRLKRLWGRLFP